MRRGLTSIAIFVAFAVIITLSRHVIDPTSSTTTTTSVSTTTTIHASSSTTTSAAGTPACQGSAFTGVFNQGQGAAGTVYASVTLTKRTAGTCSIKGWPILTLQDRTGAVLPLHLVDQTGTNNVIQFPAPKSNAAPAQLTLTNGATTNFSLAYSSVATANTVCDNAVTISVQFAAGASSLPVTPSYPLQPCDNGTIWVSPFY